MNPVILYSVLSLGGVAAFAAFALLIVAKRFHVEEDPRIDVVAEMLPGANCGACGSPGCRGFAEALIEAANQGDISGKVCPVSPPEAMAKIGGVLGLEVSAAKPVIAVRCCGGKVDAASRKLSYDGPESCAIANSLFSGEKGCAYACFGLSDCVKACDFDALSVDESGLPVVDDEKCVGCGVCVAVCPRRIMELRPKGKKGKRVWVNCRNKDKGGIAKKTCDVACIGCGKCAKACPEKIQAITIENNLAIIDPEKCISCGKCAKECPTGAIQATFPIVKKQEQVNGD